MPSKRALVIVFDGVEEVEALAPVDILRRAEIEVITASLSGEPEIKGRNGISFLADQSLEESLDSDYDLVFLPGGPGVIPLAEDKEVHAILQQFQRDGAIISAICAAPKVLAASGLLANRKATSHISVRQDLPQPSDEPIVIDGQIITSQGAGTAIPFALQLVELLADVETSQKVAASIHYS